MSDSINPDLLFGLPPIYGIRHFTSLEQLCEDAGTVPRNPNDRTDATQFIVLLGLYPDTICDIDRQLVGINSRFEWKESVGIIRILQGPVSEETTGRVRAFIDAKFLSMGISYSADRTWEVKTTYRVIDKGKQIDQGFAPPSRRGQTRVQDGWPTFVIATDVGDAILRLQHDAMWWLHESMGQVKMVMIISIGKHRAFFQFWGGDYPATPHIMQENIYHDTGVVDGNPMVIPFLTIFNRPPCDRECDLVIEPEDFVRIAGDLGNVSSGSA